ncbi:dihydrolipoyl dehydrogenase family protein [Candidatus Halobonum tyrrellensis]|uniref:Dihydrolipoamide dehydrogenase n=1 Tax=Candidatus Halobonum tyrrellensis G22 TaxID=1324957 RepID=V4J2N9_9EURY|nr:dihydrolipoyl dehydrogenase [Candidatus Halobonum tyrrellensis]ESP89667.1 dihydrolipoamide dehydrogenase [Candidatus Halobonum tyrrellensis G22]
MSDSESDTDTDGESAAGTDHDLLVLGGGTGNIVASAAADEGVDVGLVERGRLGGTCLNRGCNPSKKLIHHADVLETVRSAGAFDIDAEVSDVAFGDIVAGVTETVTEAAERKTQRAREHDHVTLYRAEGRFVGERTVEVDGEEGSHRVAADRVVLAGGSRPVVPDSIDGTDEVAFLTSTEALRLTDLPDELTIVGGGYIAAEMAHFFGTMGADVTIVGHGDVLLDREDRDVAERVTDAYRERHDLRLGYEATALAEDGDETVVTAEADDGEAIEVAGDEVLLAVGRRPNSDSWGVEAGGIDTDDDGFVETDEYLRTSADGVWAIGDIAGNYMLKHAGDREAAYAVENAVRGEREAVEYPGMAHAVFGSPQVASLGRTESEVDGDYEVGSFEYADTALGSVMDIAADAGYAKVIVGADDEILGFHVVGPQASTLVHEVSTAVAAGASATRVAETIHVHPALSQVVQGAFRDVRDVAPSGI